MILFSKYLIIHHQGIKIIGEIYFSPIYSLRRKSSSIRDIIALTPKLIQTVVADKDKAIALIAKE